MSSKLGLDVATLRKGLDHAALGGALGLREMHDAQAGSGHRVTPSMRPFSTPRRSSSSAIVPIASCVPGEERVAQLESEKTRLAAQVDATSRAAKSLEAQRDALAREARAAME